MAPESPNRHDYAAPRDQIERGKLKQAVLTLWDEGEEVQSSVPPIPVDSKRLSDSSARFAQSALQGLPSGGH